MLDSLPGVRMAGENNNALKVIRHMITSVVENEKFQQNSDRRGSWGHNRLIEGSLACVAQHVMETINPPKANEEGHVLENDSETIVGFKTIRFADGIVDEDVLSFVRWVQESFPCARFVINIRSNSTAQRASLKKYFSRDPGEAELQRRNDLLRLVANQFGEQQAYLLDSSAWVKDISHINRLVQWLGFAETCYFEKPLEFNIIGGYQHGEEYVNHSQACRYLYRGS